MAHQTGNIKYLGSFKSIRHWRNRRDRRTLAGEKGGANRDLILNNPAFARTRENMSEIAGCDAAVKAIRIGLQHLLPEYSDTYFTGRLVALVKMINVMDGDGEKGKREVLFSQNRPILKTLTFHPKKKIDFQLRKSITTSHPESRLEATIKINGLNPNLQLVPASAQFYRVINHISIISDFAYHENNMRYEALSQSDTKSAVAYSDYTPVNTPLSAEVKAAFPVGTQLSETDTVLQCVGIAYYMKSGKEGYRQFTERSMLVYDVF